VESGKGGLPLDKLSILARETGMTIGWLIGEPERPKDAPAPDILPTERDLLAAFRSTDEQGRAMILRLARSLSTDAQAQREAAD
jgi:hypothetical protein